MLYGKQGRFEDVGGASGESLQVLAGGELASHCQPLAQLEAF